MFHSHWCFLFGAAVAASLLTCRGEARADDSRDASSTLVASSGTQAGAAQGECNSALCSGCEECGCGYFYANAEAVFLAALGGTQRCTTFDITSNVVSNTIALPETGCDTNGGMVATPRITLGYQSDCCWGFDVRYWRMQEPTDVNDLDAATWCGADQQKCFRAETLDLEATRLFCVGDTQMQWAFGACYGEFEQSACLNACYSLNGDCCAGYANARNAFGGAGLTTALSCVRPIGCGNFSLFYSLRASLLFDSNATASAQTMTTYEDVDTIWTNGCKSISASDMGNLFIGELEVGGQWNYALKCLPANAFVRAAFEYQYWGESSGCSAACSSSEGNLDRMLGTACAQCCGNTHANLIGFSIGTGITY